MAQRPNAAKRPRPLSPHMTIYRWPITMASSIAHRATGIALAAGTAVIAWWLIAASSGPESGSFELFQSVIRTPFGQVILFGFAWSLAYHFLAGLRHLVWDFGYGFDIRTASAFSGLIFLLSILIAIAGLVIIYTGHAGYLRQ